MYIGYRVNGQPACIPTSVDLSPVVYTNFNSRNREPFNCMVMNMNPTCVTLDASTGMWADKPCGETAPGVCRKLVTEAIAPVPV